ASGSTMRRAIPSARCRRCSSSASGLRSGCWRSCGSRAGARGGPPRTARARGPPLARQGAVPGSNEFTATLFDLIRRGRYKATPVTTERSVFGGLRHEDVADLEITLADAKVETTPFEE